MRITLQLKEIIKALKKVSLQVLFLKVAKEKGLRQDEIDLLMKVINCESGWKQYASLKNTNGSTDWGCCMYNSYWYISKMKLITKDEALNNPRKCFEVMIDRYKKGMLKDWVCYSGKHYLRF